MRIKLKNDKKVIKLCCQIIITNCLRIKSCKILRKSKKKRQKICDLNICKATLYENKFVKL